VTDIGEYCRQVEAYLTKVNGGHLVRVVGPGFVLVRQWAEEGIPLSAVCRGIDQKAQRHRTGASKRPLRIEFCEGDVRDVYETWRRAVGVAGAAGDAGAEPEADRGSGSARRSVTRDLNRAIERLVQLGGRMDLPDALRDAAQDVLDAVTVVRDQVKGVRGDARAALLAPLPDWDQRLVTAARAAAGQALLDTFVRDASSDLQSYRGRLTDEAWRSAIDVTVERAVRAHFQLPDLAAIERG
jgi:hypothetical protein